MIVTIDADGQYEPLELGRVVEPILAGRADFVSGSRRLGSRADHRRHAGRDRVRRADQRAGPPPDHRPGLRPARDALGAHRGGDTRAAAVPGLRADDQRRAARLPPGRGADHDARPRRPRRPAPRRAGTSATACGSRGRLSTPGGGTAQPRALGSDPRRSSGGRGRTSRHKGS